MPSFEDSILNDRSNQGGSYDKILATFRRDDDDRSGVSRNNRIQVALKEKSAYELALTGMSLETYGKSAGSDLSAIFAPFQTKTSVDTMPCFNDTVLGSGNRILDRSPNSVDLLPFEWSKDDDDYVYDRYIMPSGDGIRNLVSDITYRGDSDQYRDISNIRGIGLRLPLMGVGWGHTLDGYPWPGNSNNTSKNKNFSGATGHSVPDGYTLDPTDYVAAPIDFRYDKKNNVWTSPRGFWAKITGCSGVGINSQGFYSWEEMKVDSGGLTSPSQDDYNQWARRSSFTHKPAYEVNYFEGLPSGTVVWLQINDRLDQFEFDANVSDEFDNERYDLNKSCLAWDWNILDWDATKDYPAGYLVHHKPTGGQYISKAPNKNKDPSNATFWQLVTKKGVHVKIPIILSNGSQTSADFYWDSRGQLTYVEASCDSSSSSSSSSRSSSSESRGSFSSSSSSSSSESSSSRSSQDSAPLASSSSSSISSASSLSSGSTPSQDGGSPSASSTGPSGASSATSEGSEDDCCSNGFIFKEVVIDVVCNGDGTITVTKEHICVKSCAGG